MWYSLELPVGKDAGSSSDSSSWQHGLCRVGSGAIGALGIEYSESSKFTSQLTTKSLAHPFLVAALAGHVSVSLQGPFFVVVVVVAGCYCFVCFFVFCLFVGCCCCC